MLKKRKRYVVSFLKGFSISMLILFLFYRNILLSALPSALYGIYYIFYEKKAFRKKQEYEMMLEFREGLHGISAALGAGYSMENAVAEARKDMELLYGTESLLVKEFLYMEKQLTWNQSMEKIWMDFAKRWEVEDIEHFAKVFEIAKRTGGDLIAITRLAAEKISEKIEIKREICTLTAGKRMEGRIMNLIPLGMILYFWISSPDFLDCLYQGSGRVVMTILLLLYIAAFYWSDRISDIQI